MSPSTNTTTPALCQPIQVGDIHLSYRVVMTPLTRVRADENHAPLPFMVGYYAQRRSVPGMLIISEATIIAQQAGGFPHNAGIWNEQQITEWKKITNKSFIYLQLWALGRSADTRQLAKESSATGQDLPFVAPSPFRLPTSPAADPTPRELTSEEIREYIELYAQAAENAVLKAGFDGVELHGANGFLMDQFLQDISNKRTDKYGGSIENRAVPGVGGPGCNHEACWVAEGRAKNESPEYANENPVLTYTHHINQIIQRHPDLAYLHATEADLSYLYATEPTENGEFVPEGTENDLIRELWSAYGTNGRRLITAGGYTRESGLRVAQQKGDLIAYGRLFISNVSSGLSLLI